MQVPFGPDPMLGKRQGDADGAFYQYVETCRAALGGIRTDLSLWEANPGCIEHLTRASERLESFYMEADSWGFDALCEISWNLQLLLLDSCCRAQRDDFWSALYRGLTMLSDLLGQCENDFRCRLAVADTLDNLRSLES